MKYTIASLMFVGALLANMFITSFIIWMFSKLSYADIISSPGQAFGFVFFYWWFPGMFILYDLDCKRFFETNSQR